MSDANGASTRTFDRRRAAWITGIVLLAAIPVVRMARIVLRSGALQYHDYWWMLDDILRNDGSLDVTGLFTFRNEHPVVFARVLFWLNARIGSGSNITLGFVVIAVVLVQLAVLAQLARSAWPGRRLLIGAFIVASSAALFAPQGVWNFYKSMSGAAWLVANMFALVAVWLGATGRRWWALAAAIAATMSYGTGIMVWPAVAVCTLVAERRRVPHPELIVGFVVSAVWYLVSSNGADTPSGSIGASIRTIVELAGSIGPTGARFVGAFVLLSGTALAVSAAVRAPARAVWVGLFVYGVGAIVLIGRGRTMVIAWFGEASRYASLTSITWIAWAALAISWLIDSLAPRLADRSRRATGVVSALGVVCAAAVAVGATTGGATHVEAVRASELRQRRLEVALLLDVADDADGFILAELFPPVRDRLVRIGHVPFDHDAGECAPGADVAPPEAKLTAVSVDEFASSSSLPLGVEAGFTLPADAPEFDCIVVIGPDSTVIGLAYEEVDSALVDGVIERRYRALALAERGPYRLVMLTTDQRTLEVVGGP